MDEIVVSFAIAAAFGRLCVETKAVAMSGASSAQPPSGGCVLKRGVPFDILVQKVAAAFGRLCVETFSRALKFNCVVRSRLRAAVC